MSLSNVYKNRIKSPFLTAVKADLDLEDADPADFVLLDAGWTYSVLMETNKGI